MDAKPRRSIFVSEVVYLKLEIVHRKLFLRMIASNIFYLQGPFSPFIMIIICSLICQMDAGKSPTSPSLGDIEDLIHNFLIIILEHSMRQKDGWKVGYETSLHCFQLSDVLFSGCSNRYSS